MRERAREQPSPAAASGRRENVYCCPSWRPISIAVLRSPPPFRLFPSTEGVRYRSRTMETSTAMARPVVVIQPDYSSSPLHSLLSFSLFRSPGSFPPLRCYSDNQINSLRVLKTPPLCRVILPAEPSRVVRPPIRHSRALSSTPLGHSVISQPLETWDCGVVCLPCKPSLTRRCLSCAPRQRRINRSRNLSVVREVYRLSTFLSRRLITAGFPRCDAFVDVIAVHSVQVTLKIGRSQSRE